MTSKRFTYKQLQDFLKEKNEQDKTTFFLQGAYGDCQLWAKDQQGTDREIDRGSPKDCYNAWIKNRFKEKWSMQENKRNITMNKITESKRAIIHKKVRATLKRIIKEEYVKILREDDRMSDAVRELTLYADNDQRLYRALIDNYLKNMVVKKKRGVYNHDLAIKLLEYYYQNYVRPSYKKEFGDDIKLSPQERKEFAEYYVNELEQEDDFVNAQPKQLKQ